MGSEQADKIQAPKPQILDPKPHTQDGVINVKIEGKGQWVMNKQTPSRQLWLSSPIT